MTFTKVLAVAALVTAVSTPVLAQEISYGANGRTGYHTQYTGNYGGYRGGHYRHHRGYGPGAIAAGVVGGAIGTAAAIATAPFSDSYAYDYEPVYNQAPTYGGNGFVCSPGTYYRNAYGRTQLCQ